MTIANLKIISLQKKHTHLKLSCEKKKTLSSKKLIKVKPLVITGKEKYIKGVKRASSYFDKFVQLNITPEKYLNHIVNVEKKSKQLFRNLLDNDKISKDEYDKICPKGSRLGVFYGNPKIHKPVVNSFPKFRMVLSAINTTGYNSFWYLC